ncbi:MAG: fumarate reductase subunit FrdD [Planctomycetota bacterium]
MRGSRELVWWSLFSAGGVLSALFVPAMVLATGLILPRRGDDAAAWERAHGLVGFWPVRIVLFVVLAFSLVHCAHRIRHIAMDVGLRWLGPLLSLGCYGAAAIGVGASGYLLVTL